MLESMRWSFDSCMISLLVSESFCIHSVIKAHECMQRDKCSWNGFTVFFGNWVQICSATIHQYDQDKTRLPLCQPSFHMSAHFAHLKNSVAGSSADRVWISL